MENSPILLGSNEVADIFQCSRSTVVAMCKRYPGFGIHFCRSWRIPRSHVVRVMRGELLSDVAKDALSKGITLNAA